MPESDVLKAAESLLNEVRISEGRRDAEIREVRDEVRKMSGVLNEIRTNLAVSAEREKQQDVAGLRKRIEALEKWQSNITGRTAVIIAIISVLSSAIMAWIVTALSK